MVVGDKCWFIDDVVVIDNINSCDIAFVHLEEYKSIQFYVKVEFLEKLV